MSGNPTRTLKMFASAVLASIAFFFAFNTQFNQSTLLVGMGVTSVALLGVAIALVNFFTKPEAAECPYNAVINNSKAMPENLFYECHPEFKETTETIIETLEVITNEFGDESQTSQLASMMENMKTLVGNHAKLYQRYIQEGIGTDEQKAKMLIIIEKQINAVDQSLESLKTFSGNLALMDTSGQKIAIDNELGSINEGLIKALEEEEFDV